MVEINITLFVQVFHFLCAYFLLKTFLWKHVVAYIEQRDEEKVCLKKELEQQAQFVEQKEFDIKRLWAAARTSFLVHTPDLMKMPTVERKLTREYEYSDSEVSQAMVNELAKEVVEKVQK